MPYLDTILGCRFDSKLEKWRITHGLIFRNNDLKYRMGQMIIKAITGQNGLKNLAMIDSILILVDVETTNIVAHLLLTVKSI